MALRITEIYHCILGETTHVGRPCVLVRLTGCNLRCRYCDSEFAFYGGTKRTTDEVFTEVVSYNCPFVLITGGEPLMQREVYELIDRFIEHGIETMVETGGSLDIEPVNPQTITVLDIKCPDSSESERMVWSNLDKLRPHDEVKFVVSSRADYDWSKKIIKEFDLPKKTIILISPAWGLVDPRDLARWIMEDRLPARLHLQIHKYIWGSETRGV